MLVYLRIDIVDGLVPETAYYSMVDSPVYLWRYSNYAEGVNFFRTYVHRSLVRQSLVSYNLGVL